MHERRIVGAFAAGAFSFASLCAPAAASDDAALRALPWRTGSVVLPLSGGTVVTGAGAGILVGAAAQRAHALLGYDPDTHLDAVERFASGAVVEYDYDGVGYLDEDFSQIDVDGLLAMQRRAFSADTAHHNRVDGWIVPPYFTPSTGTVGWAYAWHGDVDAGGLRSVLRMSVASVHRLGRGGYEYLSSVASADEIPPRTMRAFLARMAAGFSFAPGARYEDHRAGDPVADPSASFADVRDAAGSGGSGSPLASPPDRAVIAALAIFAAAVVVAVLAGLAIAFFGARRRAKDRTLPPLPPR